MITKTPTNPIVIASILCIPIFSPRIGTANRAAIIGALWAIAIFSYRSKYFIPKIYRTTQPTAEKALTKCLTGFFVFIELIPEW